MTKRFLVAIAATASVCACGQGAANKQANASANKAAPSANAAAPAQSAGVELRSDGVALGGAALAFGAPKDQAMQRLQAALGAPAERLPQTDDCNAGMREMVVWASGFTGFFTADRFVGWSGSADSGAGRALRTAGRIGPGSTRAEIDAAGLRVVDGPFGHEVRIDNMVGTLNSDQPDAAVTEILGGPDLRAGLTGGRDIRGRWKR